MENQETKQPVGLLKRLGKAARMGIIGGKIAIAATVGATGVYVYNQFHKSTEKIAEETQAKKKESQKTIEQAVQKNIGTNDISKAVGKMGGKWTGKWAELGGAARVWVSKKLQKED